MSNVSHLDATTRALLRQAIDRAQRKRTSVVATNPDECAECGIPITRGPSAGHKRYCSPQCNKRAYGRRLKDRIAADPEFREEYRKKRRDWKRRQYHRQYVPLPERPCAHCGEMYVPPRHTGDKSKFCSSDCKTVFWRRKMAADPERKRKAREREARSRIRRREREEAMRQELQRLKRLAGEAA